LEPIAAQKPPKSRQDTLQTSILEHLGDDFDGFVIDLYKIFDAFWKAFQTTCRLHR